MLVKELKTVRQIWTLKVNIYLSKYQINPREHGAHEYERILKS